MSRVLEIGLEGINTDLIKKWLDSLPNIKKIQQKGVWGNLESSIPPTPPVAWISLLCGKNPGSFGFWDYNYRDSFSYFERKQVNSKVIDNRVNCLYKILPKIGQKVGLVGVPGTCPCPKIQGGFCISNFRNNISRDELIWPGDFKKVVGNYIFDLQELKNKEKNLKNISNIDEQRLNLIKYFTKNMECDYAFCVLPGLELLSSNIEEQEYQKELKDYYILVDRNIGMINEELDDDTVLMINSVNTIKKVKGKIDINEWLIHNGYMTLRSYPHEPVSFLDLCNEYIDWSRTKVWCEGNNGQLFINLKSREQNGTVDIGNYEKIISSLKADIKEIQDEDAGLPEPVVYIREEIHNGRYSKYGPDMFVNVDNSDWCISDEIGYGKGIFRNYNTDCKGYHSKGYFCINGSGIPDVGELKGISLLNIAPTIMDIQKLEPPTEMEGSSILSILKEPGFYSQSNKSDDEEVVRSRLEALGY